MKHTPSTRRPNGDHPRQHHRRPTRDRLPRPAEQPAPVSSAPSEFRLEFFRRMGTLQQFRALFEYLPDVDFFAKDREGRFVAASAGTLWQVGAKSEEEMLGKCDADIHPPNVARAIREDDLRVMSTREPLIDRVEALFARTGARNWFLTSKLPIVDELGEVIGVMGYVRPYRGSESGDKVDTRVEQAVDFLNRHYNEKPVMANVAKAAHLSERQLNRCFQQVFRMSPQKFLVRTRIQAASDALRTSTKPVSQIAVECGFCDQSAFTKQFREHVGETPLVFRRKRMFKPE